MIDGVFDIAERVICSASRESPADRVLREALKGARGLREGEAAEISGIVFAYYRWFGWLEEKQAPRKRLRQALELSERFARDPSSFPDAELVNCVVPAEFHAEMTVTPEFARGLQTPPRVWLRARAGQGAELSKALGNCRRAGPGALEDALEYTGRKDLFRTAQFHAGEFELQDLSSQCVGLICNPHPGETWWDACAGEGGKLLHLSDLMRNKGLIWASDRAEWRLKQLKRRAARAGVFNYRTVRWDGGARLPTRTRFDGILVDAPCTGTGTWHRNPDARWTTTMKDLQELAEVQVQLLSHAVSALKPGGRLIYSVCTLTQAETAFVVKRFEAAFPRLQRLGLANPLKPKPQAPAAPSLTFRVEENGGNGMFVAGWKLEA